VFYFPGQSKMMLLQDWLSLSQLFLFLWESISVLLAHDYIFFHGQYLLLEISSDKSYFL